jgi:rare lipoprotein A
MRWLLCIMTSLLLSGCQQYHANGSNQQHTHQRAQKKAPSKYVPSEKDSAPKGPLPKIFKSIIPKNEPLSRYGNPDTYSVNGKKYDVMTSASGYHARGLASWYGTKFHTKRTSSGEHYDMYALTAAHRTLPLPTYARVKNLSNGKSIIVKVNDRGPFHSNRILDLSYGAAVKLGLFPRGTAMVEIEALNLRPHGSPHVAQYYVQAGAFQSSALAASMKEKLTTLTRAKVIIEPHQKNYIVKLGPFADKSSTETVKAVLQKHGIRGAFSVIQ